MEVQKRLDYSLSKVGSAVKWMVLSGTATYFLTGVLTLVTEIELPKWAVLVTVLIVNTLIFGVAKFQEGGEGGEVSRG